MICAALEGSPFRQTEMRDYWLVPERLFDGEALHEGIALRINDGLISEWRAAERLSDDGRPVWRTEALAAPGYVDLQVNGGGGTLFNNDPTPAGALKIAAAQRRTGTTACLPTLITDTPEVMERAADAILATHGRGGVAGIHLEGPHISPERRGVHEVCFMRPFDDRTFSVVRRLRLANVPVLLTLAPERVAPGTIARLTATGTVVSLGHTAADAATVRAAIAEGAQAVTHIFNAMTPMSSRDPGVVGTVLDSDLYCGFIADGHHVNDTMLRLAIRSRPKPGRMVLVSDAMPTVNGPDHFELYDERIQLQDGRLVNAAGSLAGVHIDMAASVARLFGELMLPLADALAMGTSAPSRLMGFTGRHGSLRPGARADFNLLDDRLGLVASVATA